MNWEKVIEKFIEIGERHAGQAEAFMKAGNHTAAVQRSTVANVASMMARALEAGLDDGEKKARLEENIMMTRGAHRL